MTECAKKIKKSLIEAILVYQTEENAHTEEELEAMNIPELDRLFQSLHP